MATYVIGDLQGCLDSLLALLETIGYRPGADRLWFTGDLVNRGPKSLETLRWVRERGAVTVLGNHDLHLIGRARGLWGPKHADTLDPILEAPDRDALIDWLRSQPVFYEARGWALVHAGLAPGWDPPATRARARQLEQALAGPGCDPLLLAWQEARHLPWLERGPGQGGLPAQAQDLAVFTALRTWSPSEGPCWDHKGPPAAARGDCQPWFSLPERRWGEGPVAFGHWAALHTHLGPGAWGLDGGCVWGRALCALRLEDQTLFSQPALEA